MKPTTLRAVILLMDILSGIIEQSGMIDNNTTVAGAVAIALPGVLYLIFGIAYLIYTIVHYCREAQTCQGKCVYDIFISFVVFIGSISYFIGDNIMSFAESFERSDEFLDRVNASRVVLLVLAVVAYKIIPPVADEVFKDYWEEDSTNQDIENKIYTISQLSANAVVLTLDFDTLYTVPLVLMSCSSKSQEVSIWVLFAIMSVIYFLSFIVSIFVKVGSCTCEGNNKISYMIGFAIAIIMTFFNGVYLLFDNEYPIICYKYGSGIIEIGKLVVFVVIFLVYSFVIGFFFVYHVYFIHTQKEVDLKNN